MSGGSFNYAFAQMSHFADELRNKLDTQGADPDNNGYQNVRWPADIAEKLGDIATLADYVASLAKEAEWLYSGDTGEDAFRARVKNIEDAHGYSSFAV